MCKQNMKYVQTADNTLYLIETIDQSVQNQCNKTNMILKFILVSLYVLIAQNLQRLVNCSN